MACTTRTTGWIVAISMSCACLAGTAHANLAKFRVTGAVIQPGAKQAKVSIAWEYQTSNSGYNGKGVQFFLHDKLPGYNYGNKGTPIKGTVDMKNGRGMSSLLVDLPAGAQAGKSMVLTGFWPSTNHKWGTDKDRPGGQFKLQGAASGTAKAPKKAPVLHSININSATATELAAIPGIGASKARAIVDYRTAKRLTFSNAGQLTRVPGIKQGLAGKMAPHIKFDGKTQLAQQNSAFGRRRALRTGFGGQARRFSFRRAPRLRLRR